MQKTNLTQPTEVTHRYYYEILPEGVYIYFIENIGNTEEQTITLLVDEEAEVFFEGLESGFSGHIKFIDDKEIDDKEIDDKRTE